MPQFTQLYTWVRVYRRWWKCEWIDFARNCCMARMLKENSNRCRNEQVFERSNGLDTCTRQPHTFTYCSRRTRLVKRSVLNLASPTSCTSTAKMTMLPWPATSCSAPSYDRCSWRRTTRCPCQNSCHSCRQSGGSLQRRTRTKTSRSRRQKEVRFGLVGFNCVFKFLINLRWQFPGVIFLLVC